VQHILNLKGKRLRPLMVLLSAKGFGISQENAMSAAVAVEIFHNFTLVHDDIMDKAELRRGTITVHEKYGLDRAIVTGDAMFPLAVSLLIKTHPEKAKSLMEVFNKMASEVMEGQQFDMDFEKRLDVSELEYLEMIRLKTAVLLACSLKAGALLAKVNIEVANQLYDFGINLGLAFQLQDDLLDSFGDQKTFGKRIGGDILANKKTFLLIKAMESATGTFKTDLLNWVNKKSFIEEEKISSIKRIYNQLNMKELIRNKIDYYFQESIKIMGKIPVDQNKKQALVELCNQILKRDY
ncbi:MAG: polyprenyl synthetase family protein, partial [Draconibacterium sp.]|nr:polyprenyl synthetase family protein [Draconibacterium sp.]